MKQIKETGIEKAPNISNLRHMMLLVLIPLMVACNSEEKATGLKKTTINDDDTTVETFYNDYDSDGELDEIIRRTTTVLGDGSKHVVVELDRWGDGSVDLEETTFLKNDNDTEVTD